MDGRRFDELTTILAAGSSRRQLLRALGTGLTGALAGAIGLRAVEAKPKGEGRCTPAFGACPAAGSCCDSLPCAGGMCCPPGRVCQGACCPPGRTCTDEGCCPEAQACGTTCLSVPCNTGACETCDPAIGACIAISCADGQECVDGTCRCTATSCPRGCCDANGACQVSSNATCGVGGAACSPCQPDPFICCEGLCVANDERNCGVCGNACTSSQVCCPGMLAGAPKECVSQQSICGGGCTRCSFTQICCGNGTCGAKDLSDCCGVVCPTIANAQVACDVADDTGDTGCVYQCNDFYDTCDGDVLSNECETYLLDNPNHCGRCGNGCDTSTDPASGNPKERCAGCRCVLYDSQEQPDCDPACLGRCYTPIR